MRPEEAPEQSSDGPCCLQAVRFGTTQIADQPKERRFPVAFRAVRSARSAFLGIRDALHERCELIEMALEVAAHQVVADGVGSHRETLWHFPRDIPTPGPHLGEGVDRLGPRFGDQPFGLRQCVGRGHCEVCREACPPGSLRGGSGVCLGPIHIFVSEHLVVKFVALLGRSAGDVHLEP